MAINKTYNRNTRSNIREPADTRHTRNNPEGLLRGCPEMMSSLGGGGLDQKKRILGMNNLNPFY